MLALVLVWAPAWPASMSYAGWPKASAERMALELGPGTALRPGLEEIFRRGVQLARASTCMPWWAPRRSKAVQIRLRADGSSPLRYRIEGRPARERLLSITPFGPDVTVDKGRSAGGQAAQHDVRAEFILRGKPRSPPCATSRSTRTPAAARGRRR